MQKRNLIQIGIAALAGSLLTILFLVAMEGQPLCPQEGLQPQVVWDAARTLYYWIIDGSVAPAVDVTGEGDVPVTLDGEAVTLGTGANTIGQVTVTNASLPVQVGNTNDITVTLDSETVSVDVTNTGDITVTLDSEVVAVDATGQGDVPISTSRDLTVTLDGEVVSVDVTNTDDITVTLDGETVTVDSELAAAAAAGDGASNPTVPQVGAMASLYNGSAWDRERANWSTWPFPAGVHTYIAPVVGETKTLVNYNAKGAYVVVNITGIGDGQTLTVKGYVYDYDAGAEGSDQSELIWSSEALTPTGRWSYIIYPGVGAAAEDIVETVSYPLPRLWELGVVVANNEPITFSIGVHYIN